MKRIKLFLSALFLAFTPILVLAPRALAATRTWDGGGSDNNMTTAANWSGDVAPSAGDDLVFPANVSDKTITNDFTAATSFNSLAFSGTATQDSNYTISGNSMTLVAGITHSMTGSFNTIATIDIALILNGTQTFNSGSGIIDINGNLNLGSSALTTNGSSSVNLDGVVSGTGSITKQGSGDLTLTGDNTYSGATTISTGNVVVRHANGLGTSAGATSVASGASLIFVKPTDNVTVAEPLTLNGPGTSAYTGALEVSTAYNQSAGVVVPYPVTTFSGAITLGSDTKISAYNRNGKFTGAISGNYTVSLIENSTGTFEIASSSNGSATANTTLRPPTKETTYADNQPSTSIAVNTNETAIVTGTYGDVSINLGGVLKGTGTIGSTYVYGTIAPGLSPGCLNSGDLIFSSVGTYAFEVAGTTVCTQYDQIKVTGAVDLGSSTLDLVLLNSFKPSAGQKYVIISNDASDAVIGTFNGLAQGATFTENGYTFSISYTGGDGNDVELTVTAGAPAAGFQLISNNPAITLGALLGAAAVLAFLARRQFKFATRRR